MTTADVIALQIAALQDRLVRLQNRPQEPRFEDEDDFPPIIMFRKTFGQHNTEYTYVAVRVMNKWFLSGRQRGSSSNAYVWERLLEFIDEREDTSPDIYVVTELTPIEEF